MSVAKVVLFGGGIAVLAVLGMFDPSKYPFPRCPFLVLTGLQCPGCGTQRALHQLLHFHVGEAFRYNAMMVMAIPLLLFLLAAELLKGRYPGLYRASISPALSWTVLAAVLLWWLLRNLFGW